LVQAIAVLARAQRDAAWNRGQLSNQLRSHLKQYFPAAPAAFQVRGVGLDSREARAGQAAVSPREATVAQSAGENVAHHGQHLVLAGPDQPGQGGQFVHPRGEIGASVGGLPGEHRPATAPQFEQTLVA
jgi:hypothetical protein